MQKSMVALIVLCMQLTMLPMGIFAEAADKAELDAAISEAQAMEAAHMRSVPYVGLIRAFSP